MLKITSINVDVKTTVLTGDRKVTLSVREFRAVCLEALEALFNKIKFFVAIFLIYPFVCLLKMKCNVYAPCVFFLSLTK